MDDSTRIHETLLALRRVWEAQPTLTFAQLTSRLEMQGMGLNSTDAEVRELFDAQRAKHPLQLDDLAAHTVLAELDGPGPTRATIGDGWVALWGHLRPVAFPIDEILECTAGRPLRIRDSHIHTLGRVTCLSALPPTSDDATFLLVLPNSDTALLRCAAGRLSTVTLWNVGRRAVQEQKIRVVPDAAPRVGLWEGSTGAEMASVQIKGTRGEIMDLPAPEACYRLT